MVHCALVMTSYPARLRFVPEVIEAWTHSKEQPEKKVLYLSLVQYPNREQDISKDIFHKLQELDVTIIYREGDERNFKSYYAGEDFPGWWLLQVDDDIIPGDGAFDRFYEKHLEYPDRFINCVDMPALLGSGAFYNAGMLDNRYLIDMYKAVPLLLSDLWLSFWTCYAKIEVEPMVPPIERNFILEANEKTLAQEYWNGSFIEQLQELLINEYPQEYEIAKAFAGNNAPWVKRKKRSMVYRALRRIYREIMKIIRK